MEEDLKPLVLVCVEAFMAVIAGLETLIWSRSRCIYQQYRLAKDKEEESTLVEVGSLGS